MISSLLHLVGLRPRVYYTLTNFRGGGEPRPPWPPLNTPMIFRGILEHTPQNACLLRNLVRFGGHFLRAFSEANIYEYLSSIFIWGLFVNFSAYGRPFLFLWGAFFGSPPPPEQNFLRAPMNIWHCCAQDRGMGAYAPPKTLLKLHVWSIYLIKFPHLLSVRGTCTPEKLFLSGAI